MSKNYPDEELVIKGLKWVKKQLWKGIEDKKFDMRTFQSKTCSVVAGLGCNTSHCIGGWLGVWLATENISDAYGDFRDFGGGAHDPRSHGLLTSIKFDKRLRSLFYPRKLLHFAASPKEARLAIQNFLDGKSNPWQDVTIANPDREAHSTNSFTRSCR